MVLAKVGNKTPKRFRFINSWWGWMLHYPWKSFPWEINRLPNRKNLKCLWRKCLGESSHIYIQENAHLCHLPIRLWKIRVWICNKNPPYLYILCVHTKQLINWTQYYKRESIFLQIFFIWRKIRLIMSYNNRSSGMPRTTSTPESATKLPVSLQIRTHLKEMTMICVCVCAYH